MKPMIERIQRRVRCQFSVLNGEAVVGPLDGYLVHGSLLYVFIEMPWHPIGEEPPPVAQSVIIVTCPEYDRAMGLEFKVSLAGRLRGDLYQYICMMTPNQLMALRPDLNHR